MIGHHSMLVLSQPRGEHRVANTILAWKVGKLCVHCVEVDDNQYEDVDDKVAKPSKPILFGVEDEKECHGELDHKVGCHPVLLNGIIVDRHLAIEVCVVKVKASDAHPFLPG